MQTLTFHQTHSFPFPQTPTGGSTAMTLCEVQGDTVLAFLTQVSGSDTVFLLGTCSGNVLGQFQTPGMRVNSSGMGWNPINRQLYIMDGSQDADLIFAMNPETGALVQQFSMLDVGPWEPARGFGTNGFFIARGAVSQLELRTMTGQLIATRDYPGRVIRGVSASPFSWTLLDAVTNEIVVIDPFGTEIASALAPGPATFPNPVQPSGYDVHFGPHSIAFDYVQMPHEGAQMCIPTTGLPAAEIGPDGHFVPGSPFDPQTPWDPAPWKFKHRIYVANQTTSTVYAGYLTA